MSTFLLAFLRAPASLKNTESFANSGGRDRAARAELWPETSAMIGPALRSFTSID
jgi:hypothetical protein